MQRTETEEESKLILKSSAALIGLRIKKVINGTLHTFSQVIHKDMEGELPSLDNYSLRQITVLITSVAVSVEIIFRESLETREIKNVLCWLTRNVPLFFFLKAHCFKINLDGMIRSFKREFCKVGCDVFTTCTDARPHLGIVHLVLLKSCGLRGPVTYVRVTFYSVVNRPCLRNGQEVRLMIVLSELESQWLILPNKDETAEQYPHGFQRQVGF